jgi:hypothetical protein
MPANVKVIHARDFIRASPQGEVYLEKAEQLLKRIVEAGAGLEDFEVLVDLWRLAEKLVGYRSTMARRTAILCPAEKFDNTTFFALCAENRGFNIRAFTSYEEAMEWLLDGDR